MKQYVLGFAFDEQKQNVALILKNRPKWQAGKWNGIGGKVEVSDALPCDAMVREFYEETGVPTDVKDWSLYATMNFTDDVMGGGAIVYCFKAFLSNLHDCSTCEDEEIGVIAWPDTLQLPKMHNLQILIPLALQTEFAYTELHQKH